MAITSDLSWIDLGSYKERIGALKAAGRSCNNDNTAVRNYTSCPTLLLLAGYHDSSLQIY
jgi:hypothetical protein